MKEVAFWLKISQVGTPCFIALLQTHLYRRVPLLCPSLGVDIAVVGAVSWDRSVQASDGSPDTPHGVNGNKAGRGGFVCPDCHVELLGPDELLAHFEAFHDSGGLHSGPLVAIQRGQSRMCSLPYLSVSSAEPQVSYRK
jgi:hypothetical protein